MRLNSYSDFMSQEIHYRSMLEKKELRYLGISAGLGIIGYVIVQNLMSLILIFIPSLHGLYNQVPMFQSAFNMILSMSSLLLPFAVCGAFAARRTKTKPFAFEKPENVPFAVTAVGFGVFVCLVGNYVTSVFVNLVGNAGIELSAPDFAVPEDAFSRIIYTLSVAVVPALVEEFAIRGAVMMPLRKYGDKFAVLASAVVFAVLHGNLIQAPFAFIAGLGLGYAVCATGSIWTGVVIHFINNLYSVAVEFMMQDISDPEKVNAAYLMLTAVMYVFSLLCSAAFVIVKGKNKTPKKFVALAPKKMWTAYLFNLPMIAALLMMLAITKEYVSM